MGSYVYRVTKEQVLCSDGKRANVAVYAYKPYWSIFRGDENRKMHWKSGAQASDNMAARGTITDRVATMSGEVFENVDRVGSFYDDYFGGDRFPRVKGVKADTPPQALKALVDSGNDFTADVGAVKQADGISECVMLRLKREGVMYVMTGPSGQHRMHSEFTDAARLAVHWDGFVANNRDWARRNLNLVGDRA